MNKLQSTLCSEARERNAAWPSSLAVGHDELPPRKRACTYMGLEAREKKLKDREANGGRNTIEQSTGAGGEPWTLVPSALVYVAWPCISLFENSPS